VLPARVGLELIDQKWEAIVTATSHWQREIGKITDAGGWLRRQAAHGLVRKRAVYIAKSHGGGV